MNVLHLIYDHRRNPWVGGGGSVRAHEVNRRLVSNHGARVTTICGAYPGAPAGVTEDGVRYNFAGLRKPYVVSRLTYARSASVALQQQRPDVTVVDFSAYTPIVLPSSGPPALAVVHHLSGTSAPDRWGPVLGRLVAATEVRRLNQFRWISADSLHTMEEVRARVGPGAEVRLIGNAVDSELFELSRSTPAEPYILYLGRLDIFHKGLDVLLDAFQQFSTSNPAVSLRIAGAGKDAGALSQMVWRSPVAERIALVGSVSEGEKRSLLSGARMVVMPSRMEGWGLVAAEAMAAGAPLIASAAGSLPEVTGGASGAVLVPPGDPAELAAAMERLERDGDSRTALGARARDYARERYNWDRIAEQHYNLLREVLRDDGSHL